MAQGFEEAAPLDVTIARQPMPISVTICILQVYVVEQFAGTLHEIIDRRRTGHVAHHAGMAGIERYAHGSAAEGFDQADPFQRVDILDILDHQLASDLLSALNRRSQRRMAGFKDLVLEPFLMAKMR